MDAKTERMKELVELLNQASKAYYQQDTEIMSNLEYDALYDELAALEQETGLILSKSPTQNVGYEIISELPKERHPAPMLSLDKTKSVEDLAAWLGDKTGVMSWKMDGLTVVLTYEDGVLVKAVTRGNGEIGEVITNNAKVFANLPNQIAYKGPLTIRGEAVITYTDFEVVEHVDVTAATMQEMVTHFAEKIETNDFPSDGLVLSFDDVEYGKSLGRTAKFPRDSIAFKWADEEAETTLRHIEWSPSRTGLINPVAVFDAVSLEGTSVSRASVHNVSIVKQLQLGIGDTIKVYKANMIIPQISENLTKSGTLEIPDTCPACGGKTEIREDNQAQTLVCPNPACPAKAIKLFTHFVSRNAMNIDGLSEATLQKFLDCGFIEELYDIYRIDRYETEIVKLEGFGQKSYDNMMESIEASRTTQLARVLYGLGILNVGTAMAKSICKYFKDDVEAIIHADAAQFAEIEKIGDVIAEGIVAYFADPNNIRVLREILKEVTLVVEENTAPQDLEGKTFVITGSLNHFANRDELKKLIEDRGGKVAGSVSSKTTYLINNDVLSSSSKNKKAKSLGIPIISEDDFLQL